MAAQVLPPSQTAHSLLNSSLSYASSAQQHQPAPLQRTNHGSHIDPEMVDWLTPTSKDTPLSDIRARYSRDGYVWIKNVIPRSDVFDLREQYFQTLSPTGLLSPDTGPREGIFNSRLGPTAHQGLGATPQDSAMQNLDEIHASKEYQDFLRHPDLCDWVRRLTGWQREAVLKRGLLRHNVPEANAPAEFIMINGGGLMYLENSCELGERIEKRFEVQQEKEDMPKEERVSAFNRYMGELGHLSHNAETWAKGGGLGKRWLVANYEAGDVVFHSPWMIHASGQNSNKLGRIRLASDLRFYEEGAKLDQR
ncbi:MAG: hypothetical protein Q9191_001566 [Dirinaria sp. TL-2023a]